MPDHDLNHACSASGAAPPAVLLVEDDPAVRKVLRCGLELAGLRVEVAADGWQAMVLLRRQPFDWMVTDILMPDCDGIELVQFARRQQPALRIIAMSGGGRRAANYLEVARHLGAAHQLQKPFGYAELAALITGAAPVSPAARTHVPPMPAGGSPKPDMLRPGPNPNQARPACAPATSDHSPFPPPAQTL